MSNEQLRALSSSQGRPSSYFLRYYSARHCTGTRPIPGITAITNKFTIANPPKLVAKPKSKSQRQLGFPGSEKAFLGREWWRRPYSPRHWLWFATWSVWHSWFLPADAHSSVSHPGLSVSSFPLSLLCQVSPSIIPLSSQSHKQRPHLSTLSPLSGSICAGEQTDWRVTALKGAFYQDFEARGPS